MASKIHGPSTFSTWAVSVLSYDPATQSVEKEKLQELLEFLPSQIVQLRIFAEDHHADAALAAAVEQVLDGR